MLNFCTLFDSNYLHFGLSLHDSLQRNCKNFHLYIFAFDKKCEDFLKELSLKNVTIISLKEFEDEKLLAIKSTRTKGEYCWTSTASTILYVLKNFQVESCTYLDSDIYFFSDPSCLIEEMNDKSVLITEHRYPEENDQSEMSGKYCVQFMTFKNNQKALEVLNWWRDACINWCYNRHEDGKFGDQKYLDDWMTRFDCVHELQNIGGGVAPWNFARYEFFSRGKKTFLIERNTQKKSEMIFYHFHGLKLIDSSSVQLTFNEYEVSKSCLKNIYKPYLKVMESTTSKSESYSDFLKEIKNKRCGFVKRVKIFLNIGKKNIIKRIK